MSYTEIYKFKKNGDALMYAEIRNAHRGAMSIWRIMEKKYLPPFVPEWAKLIAEEGREYQRCSQEDMKEVWELFKNSSVSETDKIVHGSTFDKVIVLREDLPKLIHAFRSFEGETSLNEQADVIQEILSSDKDFIAIAWNQTSVNCDVWVNAEKTSRNGNYLPYNMKKQNDHWNLFE